MTGMGRPAPGLSWQFWIDRGGTFTDIVARRADGHIEVRKLLSEDPRRYRDAALEGIRRTLGLSAGEAVPAARIEAVKLGTTVATNALLERAGEPIVLVTTRGFADLLRIGNQDRPDLFALQIVLPGTLFASVIEADERIGSSGAIETPLDLARLRGDLDQACAAGLRACAIVFMHGYRFPEHEAAAGRVAREAGFEFIALSHEVSPLMRIVGRGDTTCAESYVTPLLKRYVNGLASSLGDVPLLLMQSNGGLAEADGFRGKDSLISGPAGGVVGAARAAAAAGVPSVISFDMGGTSTDVAHYAGELHRVEETTLAGVRVRTPMLQVQTVAAGGGSVLWFDGERMRVGPSSAGARPGPACYRSGGPPTVTDANMALGRLRPEFLEPVFGPFGDGLPSVEAAVASLARLRAEVTSATGRQWETDELAEGFLRIAVANMANAIRQVSVQRGYDVTGSALCSFGGAGGQHACDLADELGMRHIIVHPLAGVLSAYGIGIADVRAIRERAIESRLSHAAVARLAPVLKELEDEARAEVRQQALVEAGSTVAPVARIRSGAAESCLAIPVSDADSMAEAFAAAHLRLFGFAPAGGELVIESVSVEVAARTSLEAAPAGRSAPRSSPDAVLATFGGRRRLTAVRARHELVPGAALAGPAIITDATGTTVVAPDWEAQIDAGQMLHLRRTGRTLASADTGTGGEPDPVRLEVFGNLFRSVAEEMGAALRNTCRSVNIKERLDFSCAVFDAGGNLVANAPHIPVHLGSMGDTVQALIGERGGRFERGSAFATNDPFSGGTHLPDITVVTPVFEPGRDEPSFFAASRGHHADVGGVSPGSMPAGSRSLAEEGIVLTHLQVVRADRLDEAAVRSALGSGPWPARDPDTNVADLGAQIAANTRGAQRLLEMLDRYGREATLAYMGHVQRNAEACVRRAIRRLSGGDVIRGAGAVEFDDGSRIEVSAELDGVAGAATLDFTGTSAQHPGNLNAPEAVTRAAVLYVFRTLVSDDIPLNAGSLRALTIRIPRGCMLSPIAPAAVAAGNVETSQAIVDALFSALGLLAGSQGTMNNLSFGNARRQYYETICGGAGAGPGFDGAGPVHTHMTNTRLTDPEVLELRYPVTVELFGVRGGSGGEGRWAGGPGVVRRLRFHEPMTVSVLSNHRRVPPAGGVGGQSGATGRNLLVRADGSCEDLGGTAVREVAAGDALQIETPGGGGWGEAAPAP